MDRRALFRTALIAAPALGTASLLSAPVPAAAEGSGRKTVDLGPASLTCNTLSGGFVGDRPYIVSHLLQPARVGLFDAGVTELVSLTDLPTGGGAWTSVVDGDVVYVGTHTVADLYRLDTTTATLTHLTSIPGASYIWDMSRTPDGKLYLGTYPDGKVWEYDPAADALRDLGVAVAGEKYVRSIVADDTTVYAGVGDNARLVAVDRATGNKRDITPPELLGDAFVYQLTQTASHVIAGTHGTGLIAIVNKEDPTDYRIVHPEGIVTISKMTAATEQDAYFAAGTGLWHLAIATGELRQLTTHFDGFFLASLHVRGSTVAMFANTATLWTYDLDSESLTEFDFRAAGMPPAPELPQSVCGHDGNRVYVGGHGGVEVHTLAEPGVTDRIRITGEAKSIVARGPYLYLAMYPSASLLRLDTRTDELRTLAKIGNDQNRPNDMTIEPRRKLILIASSPDYGQVDGALSIYDLRSEELQVYRGLVPGHAIVSTAVHGGLGRAFIGSERPTTAESATVASFDLTARRSTGSFVPVPGAGAIPHLLVIGDTLYGTTNQGVLFALDIRSGSIKKQATVAAGRVDLVAVRSRLYAASHQRLMRISTETLDVEVIVDDLATDPTSYPMIAYDEHNRSLYTITNRNLLQVKI